MNKVKILKKDITEIIPKYYGYYLRKNGTPIVVENTDESVKERLKYNGYWKCTRSLFNDEDVSKFLTTYNAGYNSGRRNIKPFFP